MHNRLILKQRSSMVFYLRRGGPVHGITNRFQGNRKNRLGMAIVAWTLWNETERLHLEQNIEWQNVVIGIHQTALWIMRVLLQITHWHYHHCSPCWQFPLHSKLPGWKWVFQNSDEKHLDNIRSGDSPPSCGHCCMGILSYSTLSGSSHYLVDIQLSTP